MADAKISQLPAGSTLTATDLFPVAQDQGGGIFTTVKVPFSTLVTDVAAELPAPPDLYVNITGDTMTGNLGFSNSEATETWVISADSSDGLTISGSTFDQILSLNPGTAADGNTGQTITGRFRYAMPLVSQDTAVVLGSGALGVATALVHCNNASAINLTIRANTSGVTDFQAGNFFSVMQKSTGQVTLIPQTGDVVLRIPAGYIAATRDQYSVISATLYEIFEGEQRWVISGDLAEAP